LSLICRGSGRISRGSRRPNGAPPILLGPRTGEQLSINPSDSRSRTLGGSSSWASATRHCPGRLAHAERILGAEHLAMLVARNDLADAYHRTGRTATAIAILEQLVADHERILGAEHPATLTARNNLAYMYPKDGRTGEAISILEVLVADLRRLLGARHARRRRRPRARAPTTSRARTTTSSAPPRRSRSSNRWSPTMTTSSPPTALHPSHPPQPCSRMRQ
jgi:hypothetical protein